MNSGDSINNLRKKPQNALKENTRLKEENEKLKKQLYSAKNISNRIHEQKTEFKYTGNPFSIIDQIKIFRKLFRGREDVFAVRWVSKKGKTGYSPACANEWDKKLCHKTQINCSACSNRKHIPLTDNIILYMHLCRLLWPVKDCRLLRSPSFFGGYVIMYTK